MAVTFESSDLTGFRPIPYTLRSTVLSAILAVSACSSTPAAPVVLGDGPTFEWLEGCWQAANGETTERWTRATESDLFGTGITVRDGEVVFFEFLRIETSERGYRYSAYPSGSGPARFEVESISDQRVSFVNPDHDYPQRIVYERRGRELVATISSIDGTRSDSTAYRICDRR